MRESVIPVQPPTSASLYIAPQCLGLRHDPYDSTYLEMSTPASIPLLEGADSSFWIFTGSLHGLEERETGIEPAAFSLRSGDTESASVGVTAGRPRKSRTSEGARY